MNEGETNVSIGENINAGTIATRRLSHKIYPIESKTKIVMIDACDGSADLGNWELAFGIDGEYKVNVKDEESVARKELFYTWNAGVEPYYASSITTRFLRYLGSGMTVEEAITKINERLPYPIERNMPTIDNRHGASISISPSIGRELTIDPRN